MATETNKPDDKLDALLKEFEQDDKPAAKPGAKAVQPAALQELLKEFKPVAAFARGKMLEETRAGVQKDVDEAISALLEADETKGVPKRLVKGFLVDLYNEDQEFKAAFDNRTKNKSAWKGALAKAKDDLVEQVKTLPQNKVRSDVEAARAAVAGSKTNPSRESASDPDASAMFAMSDQEWGKYLAKKSSEARA